MRAEWCDGACTDHLELQVADWSLVEQFVLGTAVTMAPLLLNENIMSSLLRMIINNNLLIHPKVLGFIFVTLFCSLLQQNNCTNCCYVMQY